MDIIILSSILVILLGLYFMYKRSRGYGAGFWWGGNRKQDYSGKWDDWLVGVLPSYGGFIIPKEASQDEKSNLLAIGVIYTVVGGYIFLSLIFKI